MKAKKLYLLEKRIPKDLVCELNDGINNLVFGKGNINSNIFFIGEAPGAKEDKEGIPFVGASGKRLDYLLSKINLTVENVYIANILKYRPPKNRNPKAEEIKLHTPFLIEQIKIIKPKIICTLGNFSTKFVLSKFNVVGMNKVLGISQLHGKMQTIEIDGNEYLVLPLYHPAASLYNPRTLKELEADIKKLKSHLK